MPLLAAWLHDLDPWAIRLAGEVGIRWYGLSYLLAFGLGWLLIRRVLSAGRSPLAPEAAGDLVVSLALGAVVGGRVGYVLLYQPALLAEFGAAPPWWGLLAVGQGGMASHGGIAGVVAAAAWWARRRGVPLGHVLDLAAFATPLGLALGRVANFVNGELVGRPAPGLAWGVKFPQDLYGFSRSALARLFDRLPEGLIGPPAEAMARPGAAIDRVIEAVRAGEPAARQVVAEALVTRHPSQLYQAGLEGVLLFLVLLVVWARPRRPWTLGAIFCLGYGVLRIVGEWFRRPDPHIADQEFALLGVTRGQWLSVLLLVLGAVLLVRVRPRAGGRLGGWRKAPQPEGHAKAPGD